MLKYYTEKEAEDLFKEELTGFLNYGYKGCYSNFDTWGKVLEARKWALKSQTVRELMANVMTSTKEIGVVGMRGGFQCFGSGEGRFKLPVVFIDLDGSLTTNDRGNDIHRLHFEPNAWKKGWDYKYVGNQQSTRDADKIELTTTPLSNFVAMFHEFGHAWQWIERPLMFGNQSGVGTRSPEGVKTGKFDFDARKEKSPFAEAIRAGAQARGAGVGVLPTAEELKAWKPPVWSVPIEQDNMSRHEWPVCKELGLPVRQNYGDIGGSSLGANSVTSVIAQLARDKAQEEAKKKLALQAELAMTSTSGSFKCPTCSESFASNMKLMQHKAFKRH